MGVQQAEGDMTAIRADLSRRIAAIEWRAGPRRVAGELDAIRTIAHRHHMMPAATVAHLLTGAMAKGGRGPCVHGWLTILHDAVSSDRQDKAACDSFAALCALRFAN